MTLASLAVLAAMAQASPLARADSILSRPSHAWRRNLVLANLAGGGASYAYFVNTWGKPSGRFHVKHEFDDNMRLNDEVSHFYAAYKLTEGCAWLFRLFRVPPEKIALLAGLEAALITTLIEYPMDAYNPSQGLGLSDLLFDYAGVGFALLKRRTDLSVDLKVSVKKAPWKFDNKLLANRNDEFDNYIWWGTWKPRYFWLGFGYSTNHHLGGVESEYYVGAGITITDVLSLLDSGLARDLKVLDTYFICLNTRL